MKIEIDYSFNRDTHKLIKEFATGKGSLFTKAAPDRNVFAEWLDSINKLGFFEAETEKGTTLVPVRNINFILLKE